MPWRADPSQDSQADGDRPWVDRARGGDADAFGELVTRYQHRIVNFTLTLTSDRANAEDLAQETFLRAYRGLASFRGTSSFKTWLYQIATNVARTHTAKRRTRREELADDSAASARRFEEAATDEDIESRAILRQRLDAALASLPIELREAVVLRDVEGLEYREISTALGVPMGTVESRIFRARQRLRDELAPAPDALMTRGERP